MSDDEFADNYNAYSNQIAAGYPDMKLATESMALMCDNAYRRIKDETCAAHIKINVDKSGNLLRVSPAQLDSGVFSPTDVVAGEFTIFAKTGRVVISKATNEIKHSDFEGKYVLDQAGNCLRRNSRWFRNCPSGISFLPKQLRSVSTRR